MIYLITYKSNIRYHLRDISSNSLFFRSNISKVEHVLEKYVVLLLQEALLTQFNANELEVLTYKNTVVCFTSVTPETSPKDGRPADGLVVC